LRADYENRSDTIQIELEAADRLDRDDAEVAGVIVGIRDERPVMIDLIGTRTGVDERLRRTAERFDLDVEALIAAARAALAAPDRAITLDVAVRSPA
jgi:phage terminase large subunit-like protein